MPADAVQLRAAVLFRTERGKPLGPFGDDERHVAQRLDVVDRGRLAVQADERGKRRFVARLGPLPLERLEERRLLARFVRAGAAVKIDVAIEARAEDVLPQEAVGIGLVDRALEDVLHVQEFAADVDVGDLCADGVTPDRTAFDEQVRIAFHQEMILERSRLALVGVAGDIARLDLLVDELPFHAGREAGAAAAAQTRGLHHVDNLIGCVGQRFLERVVSLVTEIEIERE